MTQRAQERRARLQERLIAVGEFLLARFPFIRPPTEALTRVLDRFGVFD